MCVSFVYCEFKVSLVSGVVLVLDQERERDLYGRREQTRKEFSVLDSEREIHVYNGFQDSRGETCPRSYQQHYSSLLLHVLVDPKDEQKILSSLSKNARMKAGSPPRLCHDAKHLGLQLADQESSPIQLTGQSRHRVDIMGGSNCQDRCVSSESDGDASCVKGIVEGQMKPVYLLNNPDIMINPSQISHHHSRARVPYPYAEQCFSGLLTNYGPQTIIQPQMVGIAPARVPLPLDFMDDGPIYVNPKQYHGILRRRQSRAKLEAQNKVVKTRKPYLHESRHRHALNRVRGSGGRFVSLRKLQNPDSAATSNTHRAPDCVDLHSSKKMSEFHSHQFETGQDVASLNTCSDIKHVSNSNGNGSFRMFSRSMQCNCNGGLVSGGTQNCASVVQ